MIQSVGRWARRLTTLLAGVTLLPLMMYAVLVPPIQRYRPACGEHPALPIEAPVRPVFLERVLHDFRRDGTLYFRWGDAIYVTWFSDFNRDSLERKNAYAIASGQIPFRSPPPPAVERLVSAWEQRHDRRLDRYETGAVRFNEFEKLDPCEVIRAALTLADGD